MKKSSSKHSSPMVDAYKAPTAPRGAVALSGKLEPVVSDHGMVNLPKGHGSNSESPQTLAFKGKGK